MYNSSCGTAATTGGCIETDRDCQSLISREPPVPAVEHDYSGFDIIKATQVWYTHPSGIGVRYMIIDSSTELFPG